MPQQHERIEKPTRREAGEDAPPPEPKGETAQVAAAAQKKLDALLDDIEGVLKENETVAQTFVQQGGE